MKLSKKVVDAIYEESERQGCDLEEFRNLVNAYLVAKEYFDTTEKHAIYEIVIRKIGHFVEPDIHNTIGYIEYRRVPAYFANMEMAVSPRLVGQAMQGLCEHMYELNKLSTLDKETADYLVKQFLDIHPFTEGNGRTAWIIRTWLTNTWENPESLPDYYG